MDEAAAGGSMGRLTEALRVVSRSEMLRRGAARIRAGALDVVTPEELREQRRPMRDDVGR